MRQEQYNPITRKDQRLPVRFFLVKQNHVHRVVPKHWHEGAELIYCHKGNHQVRVEKNLYTLKAGDCLYIAPFTLHEVKQIENSELYVMQISKKFLEDCRIGIDYDICCNSLLNLSGNYSAITGLMPIIRELYRINDDKDFLKITALLYELMYQLVTHFSFPIELENHQKEQQKFQEVLQILRYIKKNYTSGLKQQTVAYFFGYNSQYFARFFKRYVGSTFLEYLNSIQIEAACRMLEKTELRIIDISEECGFHSVKSFNRAFRKIYQMNPSEYKKSVSEKGD